MAGNLGATRWAYRLPVIAMGVTAALLVYAHLQDEAVFHSNPGFRGYHAIHFAPAWTVAGTLNGPAFSLGGLIQLRYPPPYCNFGRLLTVGVFWFFVGWAIDVRQRDQVLVGNRRWGILLRSFLLACSLLMLVALIAFCLDNWNFANLRQSFDLFGFRTPVFLLSGQVVWLAGLSLYFAKGVIKSVRVSRPHG